MIEEGGGQEEGMKRAEHEEVEKKMRRGYMER
jgi:hypothetical protein